MATKKSFNKEQWEAMTGTEMSQLLLECENLESAEGAFTDNAGSGIPASVTEQPGNPPGNQQVPTGKDDTAPASRVRRCFP